MEDHLIRCEYCQGNDFEEEEGNTVCTTCGVIVENLTVFTDDPLQTSLTKSHVPFVGYKDVPVSVKYQRKVVPEGKKAGLESAQMLAANYKFSDSMRDELLALFNRVIENPRYKNTSRTTKRVLAAVCAYFTMVRNKASVSIQNICDQIGCEKHKFGHHYNQLKTELFPDESCCQSIVDLIPSTLQTANFDETEREKINRCVSDIIKLEKEFLTVEGRSPVYIIIAASFVAWQSMNPRERIKFNLSKYCKTLNLQHNQKVAQRVSELQLFLIEVTTKIPWLNAENIKKPNICLYVNDVLKYSSSWSYDLSRERPESKQMTENQKQTEKLEPDEKVNESCKRKISESDNLSDISDSEVNEYIRSKKEVKILKKLQKLAEQNENVPA